MPPAARRPRRRRRLRRPVRRRRRTLDIVRVLPRPGAPAGGLVAAGNLRLASALGRGGVARLKREGDQATPAGRYRLVQLIIRPGALFRLAGHGTPLPTRTLRRHDGWCEAPRSGLYNRVLRLPHPDVTDRMWRDDHLYDLIGIFDWNVSARASYRGSAIFLHLARPDLAPTAGCIALHARDLRLLLERLGRRTVFVVG